MTNEEKILGILESMQDRMGSVESKLESMRSQINKMQEDIEMIKEDAAITREATNTLIEWAERAQIEIKIPLYQKQDDAS